MVKLKEFSVHPNSCRFIRVKDIRKGMIFREKGIKYEAIEDGRKVYEEGNRYYYEAKAVEVGTLDVIPFGESESYSLSLGFYKKDQNEDHAKD